MLAALLIVTLSFADSTEMYYAQQNVEGLKTLLEQADTPSEKLLCRYRLYPLTRDESYLEDLPAAPDPNRPARQLALLAGLWGYRAAEVGFVLTAIRYGRRSSNFLDMARAANPDDPFVLLVEGQSLIFRPAIAGKNVEAALARFRQLERQLEDAQRGQGVSLNEAQLWQWYALTELDREAEAQQLHQVLIDADLPSLYRQFLADPPRS